MRRAYVHEQLDAYAVALRRNDFPVEVYEDNLTRLAQAEADLAVARANHSDAKLVHGRSVPSSNTLSWGAP